MLEIHAVSDRFIQQMLFQALNPMYNSSLSPHSYGFRPGRKAHQVVTQAKKYIEEGYKWLLDIDFEKCFD